ncbi:hypothetical protein CDAR_423191 [Caerostris darwini]|uniref:Uncharacterized protein n=1 Tax=Caerostris darwini TaxID=1538125 RepID=A0AAV4UR47_9ARAC|nr:hypothetical protein CDAR_423191 [Caerostris darwini]
MFVIFVCERSAIFSFDGWREKLVDGPLLFGIYSLQVQEQVTLPRKLVSLPYKARKREGKVASQPSRRVPSYVPTTRVTKPQQNPKNSPRFPVNI